VAEDLELGPPGQEAGHRFRLAIGEFHHTAAPLADQVVAVVFRHRRVMPVPVIHVDVLHQSEAVQEIHGAVDAGQPHLGVDGLGAAVDLGDREVVGRVREHLKDGLSGAGELEALLSQNPAEMVDSHGMHPQLRNILSKVPPRRSEVKRSWRTGREAREKRPFPIPRVGDICMPLLLSGSDW
jgi:hypothetical protein